MFCKAVIGHKTENSNNNPCALQKKYEKSQSKNLKKTETQLKN